MLDARTTHVEHVVLLALCCLLTLTNWRINKGTRGMHWFFAYTLAFVTAVSLVALRGQISDFASIVVANLLVITAYFLLYLSVADVVGYLRQEVYVHVCLTGVALVTMLEFGAITPSPHNRMIAFSAILGLQQGAIALMLRPRRHHGLQIGGEPMACILMCLAMLNAVRIGVSLQYAEAPLLLATSPMLTWLEIVNTSLQCGTIVAYVWITAALLRRDLEIQATTDPLTGLLNRRALERFARESTTSRVRYAAMSAVITMDLDGFKQINDTLGHGCGDETLLRVAQCLRAGLRSTDRVARLGGDEFAILLPDIPEAAAVAIAQRLCASVAELVIPWGEASARVTASIGLAQFPLTLTDWDHVVTKCDQALYTAKKAGGNRVVCAPPLFWEPASA